LTQKEIYVKNTSHGILWYNVVQVKERTIEGAHRGVARREVKEKGPHGKHSYKEKTKHVRKRISRKFLFILSLA